MLVVQILIQLFTPNTATRSAFKIMLGSLLYILFGRFAGESCTAMSLGWSKISPLCTYECKDDYLINMVIVFGLLMQINKIVCHLMKNCLLNIYRSMMIKITEQQRAGTPYVNGRGHTTHDETTHIIHEDDTIDLMRQRDGCVCELFCIYNVIDLLDSIYINNYSKYKISSLKGIIQTMIKWDPNQRLHILDVYNLYFCEDKNNFLLTRNVNDYNKYFPNKEKNKKDLNIVTVCKNFITKKIIQIIQLMHLIIIMLII